MSKIDHINSLVKEILFKKDVSTSCIGICGENPCKYGRKFINVLLNKHLYEIPQSLHFF
jgi:hypothetical protein